MFYCLTKETIEKRVVKVQRLGPCHDTVDIEFEGFRGVSKLSLRCKFTAIDR